MNQKQKDKLITVIKRGANIVGITSEQLGKLQEINDQDRDEEGEKEICARRKDLVEAVKSWPLSND